MAKITFDSRGFTGNIFYILGEVSAIMHKERRINDFNKLREGVYAAASYEEALAIIREYVDLVDVRGEK